MGQDVTGENQMVPSKKDQEEVRLKDKELEIRQKEIELKEKELLRNNRLQFSPALAAILVALIGLIGTLFANWYQAVSNQRQDRQKFKSELVLKVATSDSIEQNKGNLKFFLKTGLLEDEDGKIRRAIEDSGFDLKIDRYQSQSVISGEQFVYICKGPNSYAYHLSPDCRGLSMCSSVIAEITPDSAIKLGRRPCKICFK
jgi:hypothetical protein